MVRAVSGQVRAGHQTEQGDLVLGSAEIMCTWLCVSVLWARSRLPLPSWLTRTLQVARNYCVGRVQAGQVLPNISKCGLLA